MTELWIALYFGAGALTVFWDCRHEPVHLRGRGEAALFAALSLMLSVLWPIYVLGAVMGRLLAQIDAQDRADMEAGDLVDGKDGMLYIHGAQPESIATGAGVIALHSHMPDEPCDDQCSTYTKDDR